MCGIVGYIGEKDSADVLLDELGKLEYRGYDSAGIAVFEQGKIKIVKAKGHLSELKKKLEKTGTPRGVCGIGHTRWATHGGPSDVNAHPHAAPNVTIVHNGIIENYLQLKEMLKGQGYDFVSDTDTEVMAKLIDYSYHGDPLKAIAAALGHARGSYALGILFADFPERIYAVRKDSPLIVGAGQGENFIASDIPAILKYTRHYYLLDENEIAEITMQGVTFHTLSGETVEKEEQTAAFDIAAAEKGGFAHFMLKEIYEQPKSVRDTVNPRLLNGLPSLGCGDLSGVERVHIIGCGTAMHAGLVGRAAIERFARVPAEVHVASEFRYGDPIIGKKDLAVIISQSGETADTLAALRLAKQKGVRTMAIVNVVGSSIAREADCVLYTWAGPEIAVASTKAYSVQLAMLDLLALQLALDHGRISPHETRVLCADLQKLPDMVEEALKLDASCKEAAAAYAKQEIAFFIGRGVDYPSSMEGALKLKEIAYVESEAYAAGELKHGTISLIVEHTPVIALATQSKLFEKTVSNIKEVKARGAEVLLLCGKGAHVTEDVADHVLMLPDVPEWLMPSVLVVPLQLFAYYMAAERGCDIDQPRNLAKSVTVE
ncbi:glutamine--fructose-6-phosphate transaminase (isomerizing) [Ethanoligenens harbinense]|uniref:Glutamine--fructose-6-phosphate aminotransferase [isomerizing] n=1 Tax=Ethanoligenens harbinense (strain DSM 18485 / JCM 12961 / CGMCC 1.5033 / YUAN-3) TaxID=663278 RepID=E6U8M1_ETHHY|nr:glutamine--fructose-6-phosphate transaminase (isomerizing) [Ethanoligenens harbinense]ADU26012.1 glucosamine/fructose-6-phosphate aminotransferase, isomerizing [Ethanoligenens harbinense YUAN-3]AVQ95159.1 glutamine--fructose-6-phosphate transaminase (isomerizing) [Ethanoligenens harbinense YUAN-3]AYF37849.1 glutamine--fructose-6-phosphate transaminase (isomerizing) [Ethanoligenens harbinense]AYF40572.1 glutamine--fructose-6-phosphate transaminase (isomerizing) [Ethanoligenens harbinense]QCN